MEEEKKEPQFDHALLHALTTACKRFVTASTPEQGVIDTALEEFGLSEAELTSVAISLNPTIAYVKTEMKARPEQLYVAGIVQGLVLGKVLQERKGVLQ